MITRRHLVKLLALTPIAPLVAWWTRRKHKPEPEPEPQYTIIQTVNQGTPEEHTTTHAVNHVGAGISPATPPEHIHRFDKFIQTPQGQAWQRARADWLRRQP